MVLEGMTIGDKELIKIQKSLVFIAKYADKNEEIKDIKDYYNCLLNYMKELWYNKKVPLEIDPSKNIFIIEDEAGIPYIVFSKALDDYLTKNQTLYIKGKEGLKWIF